MQNKKNAYKYKGISTPTSNNKLNIFATTKYLPSGIIITVLFNAYSGLKDVCEGLNSFRSSWGRAS